VPRSWIFVEALEHHFADVAAEAFVAEAALARQAVQPIIDGMRH